MSRPNLAARPNRDVAGVVADMMGNPRPAVLPKEDTGRTKNRKNVKPRMVNTATLLLREKTSFAIRPDVKRHLTELKLDLRDAGHRATEAEIVETLIAHAEVGTLANLLKANRKGKS